MRYELADQKAALESFRKQRLLKEKDEAERYENELFGITVRELTVDVILYGELDPDIQGVVVHSVVSAGWASLSGLRTDDIIRKIGMDEITDLGESFDAW